MVSESSHIDILLLPVHKITIIPRTSGALGYTMQVEDGERLLMSKEEAFFFW